MNAAKSGKKPVSITGLLLFTMTAEPLFSKILNLCYDANKQECYVLNKRKISSKTLQKVAQK